jgi:hypothetical protein
VTTTKTWTILALLLAAPVSSAAAQGESQDVHLRNRCRQFAQYMEVGPKHPHYEEALSGIVSCDETGGTTLVDAWRQATEADSLAVARLIYVSSRFRDRTLLDGLMAQVRDDTRPRRLRMGMLMVLVSYYAPGRILPEGATDEGINPEYCTLGWRLHSESTDGQVPVTPEDRPRILQTLQALASSDPDPFLRSAAACTASAMVLVGGSG